MPQKRQNPGKRANAARAQNQSIRTGKATTAPTNCSRSARVANAARLHCLLQVQPAQALPSLPKTAYSHSVAAKSVTGFGDSYMKLAHRRPRTIAGAFFVPAMPCYGGRAWETERSAGFQFPRFANLRTAATLNRLATIGGSSESEIGAPPMKRSHALNPSPRCIRVAAHKAMALAALHANSSLSTRLARYNHHMQRARAIEASAALDTAPHALPTPVAPVAIAALEVRHG